MNFVFLGPPGAGKGTLAAKVAVDYDIPHISTGDIFRAAIKAQSPLGLKVKAIIDSGALVSDDLTIELVKDRLSQPDAQKGFILDGFPRTIPQAEALEVLSKEIGREVSLVIDIEVEKKELIRRIAGRRVCKNCGAPYHVDTAKPKVEGVCDICGGPLYQRLDDNEAALEVRLTHYEEDTKPLLDFYKKTGKLVVLDGGEGSDRLFEKITSILGEVSDDNH